MERIACNSFHLHTFVKWLVPRRKNDPYATADETGVPCVIFTCKYTCKFALRQQRCIETCDWKSFCAACLPCWPFGATTSAARPPHKTSCTYSNAAGCSNMVYWSTTTSSPTKPLSLGLSGCVLCIFMWLLLSSAAALLLLLLQAVCAIYIYKWERGKEREKDSWTGPSAQ